MENTYDRAEEVIREWVDAWRHCDWPAMLALTQKHWVAQVGRKQGLRYLESSFTAYLPHSNQPITGINEVEAGLNREVARDYVVSINVAGQAPPVIHTELVFRLIRERRYDKRPFYSRWWRKLKAKVKRVQYAPLPDPDPEGTWGVNPISVLRRRPR